MRDMQTLATGKNERGDARASARELPRSAALGVHAAAVNVRPARASSTESNRRARSVAQGDKVMEPANETDAASIWLHLLAHGERSTVGEIAEAMGARRDEVHMHIKALPRYGVLTRHEPDADNRVLRYSVTLGCKVPRGVTLRDLVRTGAIRVESE